MRPPPGFKTELYPLFHNLFYSFGLSLKDSAENSTIMTFVKNYKGVNNADTITTNPHNANLDTETGAICNKMSIIENLTLSMKFTLTEDAITDGVTSVRLITMPIFTVFPEKLDSTDDVTTTTGAAILELTKDATQEDITPAFATKLSTGAGAGSLSHPVSTVNFTEVFGTLNLTTNTAMEGVPWNNNIFWKCMRNYTNKGAIKSMVGRQRTIRLTKDHPTKTVYIKKFVPRAVRRIMPYSYFGMLVHLPLDSEHEQDYYSGATTTDKPHVGVKSVCNYKEWNIDHIQEMTTT